jgi:hypothetical protein
MLDARSIDVAEKAQRRFDVTRTQRLAIDVADIIGGIVALIARTAASGVREVERRGASDVVLSGVVQVILAALIIACGTAATGLLWVALR